MLTKGSAVHQPITLRDPAIFKGDWHPIFQHLRITPASNSTCELPHSLPTTLPRKPSMFQDRCPVGKWKYTTTHHDALRQWSGSNKDKYEAASVAITALKEAGINACVFGSLACKLLGVRCKPNVYCPITE